MYMSACLLLMALGLPGWPGMEDDMCCSGSPPGRPPCPGSPLESTPSRAEETMLPELAVLVARVATPDRPPGPKMEPRAQSA